MNSEYNNNEPEEQTYEGEKRGAESKKFDVSGLRFKVK